MLIIVDKLNQIRFSQLMDIYVEGNQENGAEMYPNLSAQQQLLAAENDFYHYLKEVFFSQENSVYAIWCEEERYVSSLRLEPFCDGYLVCALETVPTLRNRGYASKLLKSVVTYLQSKGEGVLYSHIRKNNLPSLSVHKSCGFSVLRDYAVYTDGSVMTNSYTLFLKY